MTRPTANRPAGYDAVPLTRGATPLPLSAWRLQLPWTITAALLAMVTLLVLPLALQERFTAAAQIAFDADGRRVPLYRVEALIASPELVADTVRRLGLADGDAATRAKALALGGALSVQPTDLTNTYAIRYVGSSRSEAAAVVNDIAGRIAAAGEASAVRARIVTAAEDPVASAGSLAVRVLLALVGGAIAGGAAFLIREARTPGLRGAEDVRERFGVAVTALVPVVRDLRASDRAALTELPVTAPYSDYARAFRGWLATVGPSGRSLAIASSVAAEGKSTFSISLARTAALAGRRVVLVDCDGRVRAASKALGIEERAGLAQVIQQEMPLVTALVRDEASGMHVLGHSSDARVFSLWSNEGVAGLRTVIADLSRDFDLVVLDTPPLLALAEAREIVALADEVLLVARWRTTPLGAVKLALGMLAQRGIRPTLALTFVRFARLRERAIRPPMARVQVSRLS